MAAIIDGSCAKDVLVPAPCTQVIDGSCWNFAGPSGTAVIAVAVLDGKILIGTGSGVLKFDAALNRWSPFGLDGLRVVGFDADSVPLYSVVANQDARTTKAVLFALASDASPTWMPADGGYAASQDSFANAYSVARNPNDRKQLFLGSDGNILRSDNGGQSWDYVSGGPDLVGGPVLALAVSRTRTGRVWAGGQDVRQLPFAERSDDSGRTWIDITPVPSLEGNLVNTLLAANSGGTELLFATVLGRVLVSSDAGQTWSTSLDLGVRPIGLYLVRRGDTLTAVASRPEGVYAQLGVYRSLDLGQHWDSVPTPVSGASGTAVAFDRGTYLIGTKSGLWIVHPATNGGH